jgi:hypothetical protein
MHTILRADLRNGKAGDCDTRDHKQRGEPHVSGKMRLVSMEIVHGRRPPRH